LEKRKPLKLEVSMPTSSTQLKLGVNEKETERRQSTGALHDAGARFENALEFGSLVQSSQTVLPWWGERWHVPAFMLFVTSWVVCVIAQIIKTLAPDWMTAFVLLSALITSLVTLGRQQPLQNIIVTGVIFLVAGVGWVQFSDGTDSPLDWHRRNWRAVVLWTVILLNARGVGQFLLQPRRRSRFYGWELIGVSALVFTWAVMLFRDVMYRPIAILLLVSFFGTAALLVISLPLFMNKRPVEPPASWQPIVVLLLLLLWAYLPRI
jgi:hypothetical protein